MAALLTIRDQTADGASLSSRTLEFPTERITIRELIRERVYQEVDDFNRRPEVEFFRGLIRPADAEPGPNGFCLRKRRAIDWKQQFDRAVDAFEARRILVLVNDQQAESLDETVEITRGTEVTFLRLVMLVGG